MNFLSTTLLWVCKQRNCMSLLYVCIALAYLNFTRNFSKKQILVLFPRGRKKNTFCTLLFYLDLQRTHFRSWRSFVLSFSQALYIFFVHYLCSVQSSSSMKKITTLPICYRGDILMLHSVIRALSVSIWRCLNHQLQYRTWLWAPLTLPH